MARRNRFWDRRGMARAARDRAGHAAHQAEHAVERAEDAAGRLERHIRNEEPFWPAQIAVALMLVLYLTLPNKVVIGPQWLIPGVEGILLVGLIVSTPTRHLDQT